MNENRQFGLIIAYVVPGFIGLMGLAPLFPAIGQWLRPVDQGDWGFGPPIYALLAAIAVGMVASCVRWIVVDRLLERLGVPKAPVAYGILPARLEAYELLVESHYRYYQFYANALVTTLGSYLLNRFCRSLAPLGPGTDVGVLILCAVLLVGARDTLWKYRIRRAQLLGPIAEKACSGDAMTNGDDHPVRGGSKASAPKATSVGKPAAPPPQKEPPKEERKTQ